MRSMPFLVLIASLGCAGGQKVIDTPMPMSAPQPAKPPAAGTIQFDIPIPDAWEDQAATSDDKRVWIHRRSGGRIEMEVRKAAKGGVDTILEAELGRLRSEDKAADSLSFFSHGTLVGWTGADGKAKGMVAGRGCPDPDGPYMVVISGSWPAEHDEEMSEDLTEMAKGISLVQ